MQPSVLGLQFNIRWEDKPANYETVRQLLVEAAPTPGTLVALPEMFATGFSMNTGNVAETSPGATEAFCGNLARSHHVWLVAGLVTQEPGERPRNQAQVFDPQGGCVAKYTKCRPFSPGGEKNHYVSGVHPAVFEWQGFRVGLAVCYDLRFPELFREAVAAGSEPELFVVIANWPEKRITHWVRLLQARAIENQCYVLGVNRIGSDPFYAYPGRSVFVDPQGEVVSDAGDKEGWCCGTLEGESLKRYREGLPFLKDFDPQQFMSVLRV